MSLESANLSRRKLLKAGAIGVPAAGVLAFGSTLVTATSANAISADGWWGEETSAGLQRFLNVVVSHFNVTVDGWIRSQPSKYAPYCPGIIGGWEWVSSGQIGSPTIAAMKEWLDVRELGGFFTLPTIRKLQEHYGINPDYRLDGPSQTIMALQNEINQYV